MTQTPESKQTPRSKEQRSSTAAAQSPSPVRPTRAPTTARTRSDDQATAGHEPTRASAPTRGHAQQDPAGPDPAGPDAAGLRVADAPSLSSLTPAPLGPGRHGAVGSGHAAVAGTRSVEAEAVGHAAGRDPLNGTSVAGGIPTTAPLTVPPTAISAALPATQEAFDALYAALAPQLTWQTFLLTGNRHRAGHCVRRAFQLAWTNWPTVSADLSPEGWLRAAAFDLALSPWHKGGPRMQHVFHLPHPLGRHAAAVATATADASAGTGTAADTDAVDDPSDPTSGSGQDRSLLKALMRLPRPQRRALVLHDVIGLDWAQTAAEVEGSTPVTFGRVARARRALAEALPGIVGADPEAPGFGRGLGDRLRAAAVRACAGTPEHVPPHVTRTRARLHDGGLTLAAGALALATAGFLGAGAVWGTPMHPDERPVVPHPTRATIVGTADTAPTAGFQPPKVPAPPLTPFATGPGLIDQSQGTSDDAKRRSGRKGGKHPGHAGHSGRWGHSRGPAKPAGPGHPGAPGGPGSSADPATPSNAANPANPASENGPPQRGRPHPPQPRSITERRS
nr:hypothetical protein [Streptacidiphilus anmyonensis]